MADDELERRVTNCSLHHDLFLLFVRREERERGNVHGVSLPELDHLFNNSKTICTSLQCTAYTFDRDYCGGLLLYFNSSHVFNTKKIRTRRNARGENERSQRKEKKTWWFQWQIEEKMRQLISRRRRKKTSSRPRFSSRFLSPYRSGFSLHVGLLFFFLFAYCPAVSFLTWKGNKSRKADNKNLTPNQSNGWSQ